MSSRCEKSPIPNSPTPTKESPKPFRHRRDGRAESQSRLGCEANFADEQRERDGRGDARQDGEPERVPERERRSLDSLPRPPEQERGGQQRADYGPAGVAGAVKPEGLAAVGGVHGVGNDRVAQGSAEALAEPRDGLREHDERPGAAEGDQGEGRARQGVPADDEDFAPTNRIRIPPDQQLGRVRNELGDRLDDAEHGHGLVAGQADREQEARDQGTGHFVTDVGQETRQPGADDGAVQPGGCRHDEEFTTESQGSRSVTQTNTENPNDTPCVPKLHGDCDDVRSKRGPAPRRDGDGPRFVRATKRR